MSPTFLLPLLFDVLRLETLHIERLTSAVFLIEDHLPDAIG